MATTAWSGTYNGVNGDVKDFTPSTLGINPLPFYILEQFNAAAAAASEILDEKVVGDAPGQKFNVVLSGAADQGHLGSNSISITITQV